MTEDLRKQMAELSGVHKGLKLVVDDEVETSLSGTLDFEATANGLETISASFDIQLTIPREFPDGLPSVNEIGGKIAADYEHIYPDGALCLAVPIEERRVFFERPTLLGFVDGLLVPYLYGYCFWNKYGHHPFGEAPHGNEGILRHYVDTLGLSHPLEALAVICFLFEHGYRGHHDCPCGSGRKVRVCHGPALRVLHRHHTRETVRHDFLAIANVCCTEFEKSQLSFARPLRIKLLRILKKLKV